MCVTPVCNRKHKLFTGQFMKIKQSPSSKSFQEAMVSNFPVRLLHFQFSNTQLFPWILSGNRKNKLFIMPKQQLCSTLSKKL